MTRSTPHLIHTPVRRTAAAGAVLALTLALGACGTASTPSSTGEEAASPAAVPSASSTPSGTFTTADVTFAQMMIPHHEQAVQMSNLVLAKPGLNPQVRSLAEQIKAAQAPEISTMTGWLDAWGQDTDMGGMGGMDHGQSDGMLTDAELSQLGEAKTAQAQKLYVTGMIGHHRGAVTMAQAEIDHGSDPEAVALAQNIVATQNTEIATMTELLPKL